MRKISILMISGLIAAVSASSVSAAVRTVPSTHRPTAIGPGIRNTVPVTTTTQTNIHVPETNITTQTTETINVEITGARRNCLSNPGNVWGDRMFASNQGVPTTSPIPESDIPENNVCFAVVSMRSADIPNLAMIAPPRFFQTGTFIECGSWVPTDALNEAILDANRTSRVAATIVASIGGAAAGFFLTDLIANRLLGATSDRRDGAVDHTTMAEIQSQINALRAADGPAWASYSAAIRSLNEVCQTNGNLDRRASCMFPDTSGVHVSEIAAVIGAS